jgi:ketosteroid isomerase-like protein
MSQPSRTDLLRTAQRFLALYNQWTIPSLLAPRSPGCIHHMGPKSLASPSRTNEEFAAFVTPVLSTFRNFELAVIDEEETLVDVEKRLVSMHCRSQADTDVGPYENEYYFTIRVSRDGDRVEEIWEFLDTAYTLQILEKLNSVEKGVEK